SDLEKDIGAEVERMKEQQTPVTSMDEDYIRQNFKTKDTILQGYIGNESEVVIPDSFTCISIRAFADCKSVSKIIIPDSVTRILEGAFYNCINLTSVTFSNSLKSIPSSAFAGCHKLKLVVLPDSVKKIGSFAFANCNSLSCVTISQNTKFENNSFPANTKIIRK
ncbi:MAG: leucine-rich repeat domain-containing protein, partial [Clostridia bacterium]|nr:leucine-rich repeat domain-containing protein [Clostridia bacterium]